MIIKISNLSDGVHNFSFDEPVNELGFTEPFWGNFHAGIELEKSHGQIVLNAEVNLNAAFDCDRCSNRYNSVINTKYQIVYLFGSQPEHDDVNVTYIPIDADKISIDDDLRDYALLAIPMKKLCKEDCKGLCCKCGKDLNEGPCECVDDKIDSRWLPLAELKNKLNNN